MKKNIFFIVIVFIILCGTIIYFILQNGKEQKSNEIINIDTATSVIIENRKIQNENLLDDFIENSYNKKASSIQIDNIVNESKETILLEYVPGDKYSSTTSNSISTAPSSDWTSEDYQKYYGYFKLTKNESEEKFDGLYWTVRRQTTGNVVQVIFDGIGFDLAEIPVICEYNLDSSQYRKEYDITYIARKDNGIKTIARENQFDNMNYGLYTLAGDVDITIENDMVYSLEDAVNERKITVQSILDQAKEDAKYGICETGFYSDGGSMEYRYKEFTILKFNTLDGNKDLIIGMPEQIINNSNFDSYDYRDTKILLD